MKYKYSLLLIALATLANQPVFASAIPDIFTSQEQTDNQKPSNTAIQAHLFKTGSFVAPEVATYLKDHPVKMTPAEGDLLELKAVGHEEFEACLSLKTDPFHICSKEDHSTIIESKGDPRTLALENGATLIRDYFSSTVETHLSNIFCLTHNGRYVSHLGFLSPKTKVAGEELTPDDFSYRLTALTTDVDYRNNGYATALLTMTAKILKDLTASSPTPSVLETVFLAEDEKIFKVIKKAGFEFATLMPVSDVTAPEISWPSEVTTFEQLKNHVTSAHNASVEDFMIHAKLRLNLPDIDARMESLKSKIKPSL